MSNKIVELTLEIGTAEEALPVKEQREKRAAALPEEDKQPGALGRHVRAAANIMRALPGGCFMTAIKLDDGTYAELRILPDKPKPKRKKR